MEPNVFASKLAAIKTDVRKVERSIAAYTENDVSIADRDTYKTHLDETKVLYLACLEKVDELLLKLEVNEDANKDSLTDLRKIDNDLTKKYKEIIQ